MASVSLRAVTRRFGSVTALHPTDLDVAEGEFLTLLGPSGCGKTTTLRIIAGFVPPTTGTVRFGDDDVTRLPPNRRQIGMVFQDYALFPHLTVADNIAFALHERRVPRATMAARVKELLEMIHLPEAGERYPAQLSGGQQQRVALARAIAHPPRVLLMDEPLGALDQKMRETMQVEIRRIQQALGITTIFVTHDQAEAMSLSDSIAVMSQGHIVQRGSARQIYDRPASRFVADFIGQINFADGSVLGRDGDWDIVMAGDARLRVPPGNFGKVTIGIRPHQMFLHPPDTPGMNRLPGRVLSTSFAGNLCLTRVAVADREWLVETRPEAGPAAYGSDVLLQWNPAHTLVFSD